MTQLGKWGEAIRATSGHEYSSECGMNENRAYSVPYGV